jgi:hypothetical protein
VLAASATASDCPSDGVGRLVSHNVAATTMKIGPATAAMTQELDESTFGTRVSHATTIAATQAPEIDQRLRRFIWNLLPTCAYTASVSRRRGRRLFIPAHGGDARRPTVAPARHGMVQSDWAVYLDFLEKQLKPAQ